MQSEHAGKPPRAFSATLWLKISFASLLTALTSATVLYVHLSSRNGPVAQIEDDASSFVAPRGILDGSASFALLEQFEDTPAPQPGKLPDPVAPLRLLDPGWKVSFAGTGS